MDKIRIKCPVCGAILETVDNPANAEKNVTCPNCKQKNKFKDFKRVASAPAAAPSDETQVGKKQDDSPGYLLDRKTGKEYPLREGRLVVGRKPQNSPPKADIAIVTNDMYMSREHLNVDVMFGQDGHFHVYVSNAKNQNPTFVNDEPLEDGNKVGVRHGDIIKLGETPLQFKSSNPFDDTTEI